MKQILRTSVKTILVLVTITAVSCGGAADKTFNYPPPEVDNLARFSTWAGSGELSFKITRVAYTDELMVADQAVRAKPGSRFVVVTLHVMPAQKGKGAVDYVSQASLVDRSGAAYQADPSRFKQFNNLTATLIQIKSGNYLTYKLPFLVPKDFQPVALRCVGGEQDAQPVHLALSMD